MLNHIDVDPLTLNTLNRQSFCKIVCLYCGLYVVPLFSLHDGAQHLREPRHGEAPLRAL